MSKPEGVKRRQVYMYLLDTLHHMMAPSIFHEKSSDIILPSEAPLLLRRSLEPSQEEHTSRLVLGLTFSEERDTAKHSTETRDDAKIGKVHPLQESDPTAGQATVLFPVLAMESRRQS